MIGELWPRNDPWWCKAFSLDTYLACVACFDVSPRNTVVMIDFPRKFCHSHFVEWLYLLGNLSNLKTECCYCTFSSQDGPTVLQCSLKVPWYLKISWELLKNGLLYRWDLKNNVNQQVHTGEISFTLFYMTSAVEKVKPVWLAYDC